MIYALLAIHFLADFKFQSQWMAVNKSKCSYALMCHVAVYSLTLFTGVLIYSLLAVNNSREMWSLCWIFALVNGVMHFVIDYFTSKIAAYYYERDMHCFFTTIGFDQLLHTTLLIYTSSIIMGGN